MVIYQGTKCCNLHVCYQSKNRFCLGREASLYIDSGTIYFSLVQNARVIGQLQYWVELQVSTQYSNTFLIDNHVRLHSSQNASYTKDVCDMHFSHTFFDW